VLCVIEKNEEKGGIPFGRRSLGFKSADAIAILKTGHSEEACCIVIQRRSPAPRMPGSLWVLPMPFDSHPVQESGTCDRHRLQFITRIEVVLFHSLPRRPVQV
jgi:hypothetical protein